jgi:hypothetical protein
MLSPNFPASDLLEAGETWQKKRVRNEPVEPATWVALRRLCHEILEPVLDRFGRPEITYGFASPALTRNVPAHIAPYLDQHAGHERKRNGAPICGRLGQAVDFHIHGVCSAEIALWITEVLPFDRLYFYGCDRPIHVSIGPDDSRAMVAMLPSTTGRRTPRNINRDWLMNYKRNATGV